MSSPFVSVIIPCYNRESCVKEAIESVLSQDYTNLEVIAVDDHSSDHTLEVLHSIEDSRLRVVSNPGDRGPCTTRNYGLRLSESPWIAYQDSDDIWLPGKLRKQMERLESGDYIGAYCGMVVKTDHSPDARVLRRFPDRTLPNLDGDILKSLLVSNFISTQTIVARRNLLEEIGGFDEAMPALVDWEMMIRLVQKGNIAFVDEDLVVQRFSDNSITHSNDKRLHAQNLIVKKHKALLQRFPKILAYHHHRIAGGYRQLGDYKAGSKSATAAWKQSPGSLKYLLHAFYLQARTRLG